MSLLSFSNLNLSLGVGREPICVSGEIQAGKVLAIRGASGTGKTTLLRTLARLREHTGGTLLLKGIASEQIQSTRWRHQVHYLPQRPVIIDGTVEDNILLPFTLSAMKNEKPPSKNLLLEALDLLKMTPTLTQDARTLSGGEMARTALLRAIFAEPTVLLLDEPTAALDSETRQSVLTFLRNWLATGAERGLAWVSHLDDDLAEFPLGATLSLARMESGGAPQ